jgi:light-regulated signal transduction histidine kinase (bacteriophytochrome)
VITPWRTNGGEIQGYLKITRDMTARKEAEEKLADLARRLQQSNSELEQFASIAAHDLQEPLRKIQAFSERLQAKAQNLDEQSLDYLQRIVRSVGRMRDLINDLLMFSRVSTKAKPFEPARLDEIAQAVISDLEGRIQQTGGRVEVETLPQIDADPMQIRQLLTNLIGNALKFRRPEEPPLVRVASIQNDTTISMTISDNGIGFDEAYLDRIFQVFQRLHGRQEYEGTGMGLAICKKIVERHSGTITAKSEPGKGSTFIVTLPRHHQEEKNADPNASPRPGVILLDLNMPKKDGREALCEIKADPELQNIPIIVLTTSKQEEDILRSYQLHANSYITKPVTFEALVQVVGALGKYWLEIVELPEAI